MVRDLHDICMDVVLTPPFDRAMQESFFIDERPGRFDPIPDYLNSPGAANWLASDPRFQEGLFWRHQRLAFDHLHEGKNVCLTTGTGSGKSAVFMGQALRALDENPNAKILAFYPAKALQSDQLGDWSWMFQAANHSPDEIGIINGDVDHGQIRLDILDQSKLILQTPDTAHAWMLPNLDEPSVQNFLADLNLIVLDEAHVYDRILGSQMPYLMRRLIYARNILHERKYGEAAKPLQIISASASLRNADAFMKQLTGQDFVEIGPEQDGSAKHRQDVVHLAASKGDELSIARNLIFTLFQRLESEPHTGTGICFIDSRAMVEKLAEQINLHYGAPVAKPYRGGFSQAAREDIAYEIKLGKWDLIVSTSVLELGVDLPDMSFGMSVGTPGSSSTLQQRLGRVGRSKPGLFVIIAPPNFVTSRKEMRGQKDPLKTFCQKRVVQPVTYLDNERILVSNALCLENEMKKLGLPLDADLQRDRLNWPQSFLHTFEDLRQGTIVTDPDFADIIKKKRSTPHSIFGLRELETPVQHTLTAKLLDDQVVQLGTITKRQAMRECYPGAIYRHNGRKFEVAEWTPRSKTGNAVIQLQESRATHDTYPKQQTWVNLKETIKPLPGSKSHISSQGSIIECSMKITDRVAGYFRSQPGKESMNIPYPEDANLQVKTSTTGVLIDFRHDLFEIEELRALARLIRDYYCQRSGVATDDVDFSTGRIYRDGPDKPIQIENAIAIYDRSPAGLRLTRNLSPMIRQVFEDISRDPLYARWGDKLQRFVNSLHSKNLMQPEEAPASPLRKPDESTDGPKMFPPTSVVWHKPTNGEPELVTVHGFKRVGEEVLYEISPYNSPAAKGRTKKLAPNSTHYVNQRYLRPKLANGD